MLPEIITEQTKIYILAGNMKQAEAWAHENRISKRQWAYARVNSFRGMRRPFYVIVGTFIETSDWHIIIEELRFSQPIALHSQYLKIFQSVNGGETVHYEMPMQTPERLKTFKTIL